MRGRVAEQDGIAMPVAIIVLMLALMLTSALMLSAARSSRGANDDRSEKRALQVADAGIDVARSDVMTLKPAYTDCISRVTSGAASGAVYKRNPVTSPMPEDTAAYCAPVTGTLADGTTFSYQLSRPANAAAKRTIVSGGTTTTGAAAARRVAVDLGTTNVDKPVFGPYGVSSYDSFQMTNNNLVQGDVRTNGNLEMNSNAEVQGNAYVMGTVTMSNNAKICGPGNLTAGPASPAPDIRNITAKICGTRTTTGTPFAYDPVPASLIPTVAASSNSRLCVVNNSSPGVDGCGMNDQPWFRGIDGDRVLYAGSNSYVTLGGTTSPYLLCGIRTDGNAKIIVPAGKKVTIIIDKPENCSSSIQAGYRGNLQLTNNMAIDNQNCGSGNQYQASDTLQIILLGSTSIATTAQWDSNATTCGTLFAPNSTATFTNNGTFYGAVAAKQVNPSSNGKILTTTGSRNVTFPGEGGTTTGGYRECVQRDGDAATDGCATG